MPTLIPKPEWLKQAEWEKSSTITQWRTYQQCVLRRNNPFITRIPTDAEVMEMRAWQRKDWENFLDPGPTKREGSP